MGLKNSKTKKNIQNSLIFDKHDKNLNLLEDDDLGLDIIKEKKIWMNESVNFLNKKLKKIKIGIINKCGLPNKKKNILIEYNELLVFTFKEIKNSLITSNMTDSEIEILSECEVLRPILSLNKKTYLNSIFEKIKDLINSIFTFKFINLNDLRDYINKVYETLDFFNLISELKEILKDKNNKIGKSMEFTNYNDEKLIFTNIINIFMLCLFLYEKTEIIYEIQDSYEKKINKEILSNNMFNWLITYLKNEKKGMLKLYNNRLSKFNEFINEKFSKKNILKKINNNKINFDKLVNEFYIIIKELDKDIKYEENILLNPIKNKFNFNYKILLKKEIFKFFIKKENINPLLNQIKINLNKIIFEGTIPFSIKYINKIIGFKFNMKIYCKIIYCVLTSFFYYGLKIFKKKNYLQMKILERLMYRLLNCIYTKKFLAKKDNKMFSKIDDLKVDVENLFNNNIDDYIEKYNKEKNLCISEYVEKNYCIDLHIFIICSLFININGVKIKYFNGNTTISLNEYNSIYRLILIHFLRELKNFDYGHSNYIILTEIESIFLNVIYEYNQNEINVIDKSSIIFNNYKADIQKNLIGSVDRLKSYLDYSLNYDFKIDFNIDFLFNNKKFMKTFYSFKLLNKSNSKFVNLMIPGFLSHYKNMKNNYSELINLKKGNNFVLFKWAAFDKYSKSFINNNYNFDNLLKKDFFNIGINLISNEYYKVLFNDNDYLENFNIPLYYMAVIAGKTLAFLITENIYFGNRIISLWGNGLGSIVAYYCLKDLFRLNKSQLLYNVIFIGGLQCYYDLNPEIMKLFIGNVFNVFSIKDSNLRYLNNISEYIKEPVGLREIVDEKYSIKYYNLDLSNKISFNFDYYNYWKEIIEFIDHCENYMYIYNRLKLK